jgi:hypothetical protein
MKEWFGRNLSVGTSGLASEYNPFSPEWLNGTGWARFRGTTPMAGQGYARSFIPPANSSRTLRYGGDIRFEVLVEAQAGRGALQQ